MMRAVAGDVFPRQAPRNRKSPAEVAVWEALRRGLPSGWRAWHSLRLRNGNRWEGDGDFVIAAPDRGVLVLEVKGGAIDLRDGRWFQNGHPLDEAPRQQAIGFAKHLINVMRKRGIETPAYGVACCFPDCDFSDGQGPAAGDLDGLVLGPRHLDWLDKSLPGVLSRALPDFAPPRSTRWLTALHELWGETWVPTLNLADEARDSDARTVALLDAQLAVLAAAEDNPRALVTGGAGTGKTLLARELCARAAARGQRVLYLCFTDALGQSVDRCFAPLRADGANVRAMPIRRFAAELLATSGATIRPDDPTFWATASLTAACDALPTEDARPDLVVVDEAQDLDAGDWDLVGELAGARGLWILGDERQAFWRRPPIPDALTRGAARLKLGSQLRNPVAIATLAARYLAPALARGSDPAIDGVAGAVRLVEAAPGGELERLAAEVIELLRGGARPSDIAILTLAGQSASQLLRQDTLGSKRLVRADHPDATNHLIADTFLRFKGLERPFVILVELAAGHASEYEARMHIAITRATSRLIVIATPQDVAADVRLAKLLAR
jgi:hypothetical protein